MVKRPQIAVPIPTVADHEYNRRCWPEYAEAIRASGGDAMEVSLALSSRELAELAAGCDGIVLPGSPADVDPRRYGQEPIEECSPADPAREAVDIALLEHAYYLRKPLLCICFGAQILNVWRGGTLVQDLTCLPVNHAAGPSVGLAHAAVIAFGSVLGSVLGEGVGPASLTRGADGHLALRVNSSHHQAVGIPGEGLFISARCPEDAVIEALDGGDANHWVLGVQWHPERNAVGSSAGPCLFGAFVGACRRWGAQRARKTEAQP